MPSTHPAQASAQRHRQGSHRGLERREGRALEGKLAGDAARTERWPRKRRKRAEQRTQERARKRHQAKRKAVEGEQ
jgi:hypothetical protein